MAKRNYRIIFFTIIMFVLVFLTSCTSCANNGPKSLYEDDSAKTTKNVIEWINLKLTPQEGEDDTIEVRKEKAIALIQNYAIEYGITGGKKNNQYKYDIIQNYDVPKYVELVNQASTASPTDTSDESKWVAAATYQRNCTAASNSEANKLIKQIEEAKKEDELNVNDVVCAFALRFEERTNSQETAPIHFYTGKEFWSHLFNNLLVFPIAWIMVQISNLFGGIYIIGLMITTLLVRTIAWPIYAKTNDMSLKMQLMQPELTKIQERYGNRQDDKSKQMMQMEMAQLYKKYKVGLGGCLMPILQFPIFMAVYRAVSSIPYTKAYSGTIFTNNWANELNSRFLGIDLFEDRTAGTGQLIGIIILMIIVVGTQFLSQWLSQRRQKKSQQEAQSDIPLYRRQSYEQEKNSTQSSMKIMMYMMMLMMGLFVFTSKAGLGVYWCIGNLYSMAQMAINSKTSAKKLEKLKKKY